MALNTVLLLLFSTVISTILVYLQYYYRVKNKSKIYLFLAILRFFIIFVIILLLINPKIDQKTYVINKTPLPIIVDNSKSIKESKQDELILTLYEKIINNKVLKNRFDIQSYSFDHNIVPAKNFNFTGSQTNIDQVAKSLNNIYTNKIFPSILLTDGNATIGSDYVYSFNPNNAVYPIIIGDTTTYTDLRINQLNVNKYAFYKNKFPIEVFLQYEGNRNLNTTFTITQENNIVHKENIIFSNKKKTAVITILLQAEKIGSQVYKATLNSDEIEKILYNNTKKFVVDIIDQKSEIAIVSAINHPDIGSLKRSIEANLQHKVVIVKPDDIKNLKKYNILILYQPTSAFKTIFDNNKIDKVNTWIITGLSTDNAFLNQEDYNFNFNLGQQKEDYLASFNSKFNLFSTKNIGFETYPPLENTFGSIQPKRNTITLLNSRIKNIETNTPLLAYSENEGQRNAYLFGENIWKWRIQNYLDKNTFEDFDMFIDKTVQFLSSDNRKKTLIVNHDSFYNLGDAILITAQYFNKNYELDDKAHLTISLTHKKTNQTKNYDLLRGNNIFKVNLDGLIAGEYTFTVKETTSNTVYNGYFEVLSFDIEKQFVNPDLNRLIQLGKLTKGKSYFPNEIEDLISFLLKQEQYKPIQKEIIKNVSLINSLFLLIFLILLLAAEWFIRKYNGLL